MLSQEWKKFWDSMDEKDWMLHEQQYENMLDDSNRLIEKELDDFSTYDIWEWSGEKFYDFLHDRYYVWKYTAKNRLETTRNKLKDASLSELSIILKLLKVVSLELADMEEYNSDVIKIGLSIATMIPGLGIAGASGLLAILFPEYFGTVDQFVVNSLEEAGVETGVIYPESITLKEAVVLEKIMYDKASNLNKWNKNDHWTPRRIDKVLWAHRKGNA